MPETSQEPVSIFQELTQAEEWSLWGAVIICMAIVAGMQYRAFGTAGKTRVSGNITSFFYLHEIVDKSQRNICAVAAALPLSSVFFVVAIKPETFGSASLKALLLLATGGVDLAVLFGDRLNDPPPALFPFAILILSLLLFGRQMRSLFRKIEKGVVSVVGFVHRAEGLARTVSDELLRQNSYEDIVNILEAQRGKKLALAEELECSSDVKRLSFQLLHLAKQDIPVMGLRKALLVIFERYLYSVANKSTLDKLRGPVELQAIAFARSLLRLRWLHVLASVVITAITCGIYAGLVPLANVEFARMGILWPEYGHTNVLLQSMLLVVLASLVPLFFGLLLLAGRTENFQETIVQRLSTVLAIVFLLSGVANFAFVLMQRIEMSLGSLIGTNMWQGGIGKLVELPEIVYVLSHSLIPGVAVLGMVIAGRWVHLNSQGGAIAVGTGIIGVGHVVCYAVFEEVAGVDWGYYWHQGLLAFVLTAVAFAIGKLFGSPSGDETGQQLAEAAGQSAGNRG